MESDVLLFWNWANDPDVRNNAFHSEEIPLHAHKIWFAERLRDASAALFVIESSEGAIGQVRLEDNGGAKQISYSIARQFRGKGLGCTILSMALNGVMGRLVAEVKMQNIPSIRVFKKLGFHASLIEDRGAWRFEANSREINLQYI